MNDQALQNAVAHVNDTYGKLCDAINKNLDVEAEIKGDLYENLITLYSEKFGYTGNQFEDLCTDIRLFGWDNN